MAVYDYRLINNLFRKIVPDFILFVKNQIFANPPNRNHPQDAS